MLCQQTSPKRWIANVNMMSYEYANVNMTTTIRHCSIPEFERGHPIKQSPRASPDLCTPLTASKPPYQFNTMRHITVHCKASESAICTLPLTRTTPNQGCQIFSVASGQNPDKKWPKWLFFENVMAKITKCFNCGNFYIHRGLKLFGSIFFAEKNMDLTKNQVLTLKQQ